ncbi:MAG: DUF7901 domain-containing protein [Planctomycetota bacterium]|jgi:hypothetical protein
MRELRLRILFVFSIVLTIGVWSVAVGDWDPGDPSKMHFPQLPDRYGWDVGIGQGLADDWRCTETGTVDDIHIWCSFFADDVVPLPTIDVAIYSDNPTGPGGWSQPSQQLWLRQFSLSDGDYTVRHYGTGNQGYIIYHDPQEPPVVYPNNHLNYYQINITGIEDPFEQEEGTIYWLYVYINPNIDVGWKTSQDHFNDAAVWWDPMTAGWFPMEDPYEPGPLDLAFVITGEAEPEDLEYGDAPEGDTVNPVVAYPSLSVNGWFPSCKTVLTAGYVEHNNFGAWFGPQFDFESDGDAGLCPPPGCFPPYDVDECYADGDAGLIIPEAYTIDASISVVPCPCSPSGTPLGVVCQPAVWGVDVDIEVHNHMPSDTNGFVNVLFDWVQDGDWGDTANCVMYGAPEHVLVNLEVPNPYDGPLSGLLPAGSSFTIGPNSGYVWARFSITEQQVPANWDGSGTFEDGESEDYLIRVDPCVPDELDYGDAPDPTYETWLANDGARHVIAARIYLGSGVDADPDGQPDATATGDDFDGNDDEDGVFFSSALIPGMWATVDVNSNAVGLLDAWVDFGGDGGWPQPIDQIFMSEPLAIGMNYLSFFVPFGAQPGSTFARFRFSTAGGLTYIGQADDGEVEDYEIDIEENAHIKWIQLPDASPNGIDIKVDEGRWLADDFECTSTGLITDVHLWGSWKYDEIGEIQMIHLSFHSDDPCGPNGHSEPNDLLWDWDFYVGDFEMNLVADLPDGEYWWDPVDGVLMPGGDYQLWRVDIYIDPNIAFEQKGDPCNPVIYWLDVQVQTSTGEFGWKTRRLPEHFMDDAVYHSGGVPLVWRELRYPNGHPFEGKSIDMAFVLTGEEIVEPKAPVPNLKWSQPPIEIDPALPRPVYCGWDEESWTQDPDMLHRAVADDFRCLGDMPVTSIHWWGSHVGWDWPEPPADQEPISWWVSFWDNIPADSATDPNWSRPGNLLWGFIVDADRVDREWVGYDTFPEVVPETCFQYYLDLNEEEYFWQGDFRSAEDVFWLGIVAVYPTGVDVEYPWGWKTRPWSWMDDAVTYECRPDGSGSLICQFWPIEDPLWHESFDAAFELDTDPNYIKWDQAYTGIRHWPHYEDERSVAVEDDSGLLTYLRLVADDWPCNRTWPVTAITWYGSYIGYRYEACTGPAVVLPKPDHFLLQIWDDVPAGVDTLYSHPNEPIWGYRTNNYDEVLVGYDKHPEDPLGPPREPVFRYSVELPRDNRFYQKEENGIYWLSVVAVYRHYEPSIPWGWTNHKYNAVDDAVAGYFDPPGGWSWEELFDQTGKSEDMSFTLFTDPNACRTCFGDLNGDGWVMLADMYMLIGSLNAAGPPYQIPKSSSLFSDCADMNGDGWIMLSDMYMLIGKLNAAGPPYQIPCP